MQQPVIHGYIRVSTHDQAEFGRSLEAQEEGIHKVYEARFKPEGYAFGRVYRDSGVSASKPLRCRPQGLRLCTDLRPGDAAVFPRLDRGFRNTQDLLNTVDLLHQQRVRCVFLDLQVDTASPIGMFQLTLMGAVATFERQVIGQRVKEVLQHKKARGERLGRPPLCTRYAGPKGRQHLEVVPEEFEVGRAIVRWRNPPEGQRAFTWEEIYFHLKEKGVVRPRSRNELLSKVAGKDWSIGAIRRAYLGALTVLRGIEEGTVRYPKGYQP